MAFSSRIVHGTSLTEQPSLRQENNSVRLVTSSGNEKLDSYHLRRVKRWKLKPSENGREGVTIGYEYIRE